LRGEVRQTARWLNRNQRENRPRNTQNFGKSAGERASNNVKDQQGANQPMEGEKENLSLNGLLVSGVLNT